MFRIHSILCLIALAVATAAHAQTPTATHASTLHTAIAPQELSAALQTWARQSGIQVMYLTQVAKGIQSPGAPAGLTPDEALKRILAGTGLSFKVVNDRAVSVFAQRESAQDVDSPAEQMRLARVGAEEEGKAGGSESRDSKDKADIVVQDKRIKPDFAANADIPRTINDAQPYYIFDSKTIERSGATNVEDFLKNRLTMNTVAQTNAQIGTSTTLGSDFSGPKGNISTVNLRGVGADKTLILVNGRRRAGIQRLGLAGNSDPTEEYQPDLNGIPLSAIERIEVLPSSASAIYGGSAIGGVVNVILKRDYSGGVLQPKYENTWDNAAQRRSVSLSYGIPLEGGKTQLSFNAAWSDAEELLLQSRKDLLIRNIAIIQSHSPSYIYGSSTPVLGNLPNITRTADIPSVLKNGTSLGSRITHIPAGVSPTTSREDIYAALLANAGQWNLELPATTQAPTGLLRPLSSTPETKYAGVSLRRQLSSTLEAFASFSYSENRATNIQSGLGNEYWLIPSSVPTNPFAHTVRLAAPDNSRWSYDADSNGRTATVGIVARLPGNWMGGFDYSWSESRFSTLKTLPDIATAINSGAINPFVNTLLYPLDFQPYRTATTFSSSTKSYGLSARASGNLPALPWGTPALTVGLDHGINHVPEHFARFESVPNSSRSEFTRYFERETVSSSAYAETMLPLIKTQWLHGVYALDLQLVLRGERSKVNTGTPSERVFYNLTPAVIEYASPTMGGQPYFSSDTYTSNNHTIGLRYQPVEGLTVRVTPATAFLPPKPIQLTPDPVQRSGLVNDLRTGQTDVLVSYLLGGNPDLVPQSSKSLDLGVIWEPKWQPLEGLRLNLQYLSLEQFNAIDSLGVQTIVDQEDAYPGRVVRDSTGTITLVDASMVNLYHRKTTTWDLGLDYAFMTSHGTFNLHAMGTRITELKTQYSPLVPEYEAVGYHPIEGGAAKYKANAALTWEQRQWVASWAVNYFDSYKMFGAAGGPISQRTAEGAAAGPYIEAQGSDTVPTQIRHDVFFSYLFDRSPSGLPSRLTNGLTIQVGIQNIFDKAPPLDVTFGAENFYSSPYSDMRLRSYSIGVTKAF